LNYWQALDTARKLARRQPGAPEDESRPLTVTEALDRYRADLRARGGAVYNAKRARTHLTDALLSKPVALLSVTELKRWRDALLAKGLVPASVNRTCATLRAALELAAAHDHRIANTRAFKVGLAVLPDAQRARNVVLGDATVLRLVAAAYAHDRKLGLLADTLAVTGARPIQAVRLTVEDLKDDPVAPKLMMPKSAKGGTRNRAKRKTERYSVPITPALAAVLKQEASGRASDAPLLTIPTGDAWAHDPSGQYRRDVRDVVTAVGLDPDTVTLYALRHSSIVRALLANVPIRIVASLHDTSVAMVEKNYSHFIPEHSDAISRKALLHSEPPSGDNIVALPERRPS
jgi:integrase